MLDYQSKKLNIPAYISVVAIILMLIVVFFIMYKYQVEGEAVPPFKITKLVAVSTAKTENIRFNRRNVYSRSIAK